MSPGPRQASRLESTGVMDVAPAVGDAHPGLGQEEKALAFKGYPDCRVMHGTRPRTNRTTSGTVRSIRFGRMRSASRQSTCRDDTVVSALRAARIASAGRSSRPTSTLDGFKFQATAHRAEAQSICEETVRLATAPVMNPALPGQTGPAPTSSHTASPDAHLSRSQYF